MTPNDIEILIHCHVSPMPHPRYNDNRGVFDRLVRDELIIGNFENTSYRTTNKGAAHIQQLCTLPYPKQAWVDAQGEIIDIEP